MSAVVEKRGLGEQIGVAVNSSHLVLEVGHETSLDRVAAFGYAGAELLQQSRLEPDRLAAELAPVLWRSKYGDDVTATLRALTLLRTWLLTDPLYAELDLADPGLVGCFAARLMDEWLTQGCPGCKGSGHVERGRNGARLVPQGRYRNAKLERCDWCTGTGRRKINDVERRRWLGAERRRVHAIEYDMLWKRRFSLVARQLQLIAGRVRDPLHSALGRGTVRA